jgi:hypothetical protein
MSLRDNYTRLYTFKVPADVQGTHTDFVAVLKFADFDRTYAEGDTLTGNLLDYLDVGGGDLRFSYDFQGDIQLPCEVVKFDKSEGDVVWVKIPSAFAGRTFEVWGNNTGDSQPAVTDTYGRNAVWSDYNFVSHDGGLTDSASGTSMQDQGSGTVVTGAIGDGLTAPRQRALDSAIGDQTAGFTLQTWHNGTGNGTLLSRRNNGDHQYALGILSGKYFFNTTGEPNNVDIGTVATGWQKLTVSVNTATDINFYVNGAPPLNMNRVSITTKPYDFRIGYRDANGQIGFPYDGIQDEIRVRIGVATDSWESTEYDNQSATTAWFDGGYQMAGSAPSASILNKEVTWRSEVDTTEIDRTSPLTHGLFFANATTDELNPVDAVSGAVADTISTLSVVDGEWYQQDELNTLDPTIWNIAYPHAALGGSDDSEFTFHWRVRVSDVGGTAAKFFHWGDDELSLQRYLATLKLKLAGSEFTIASNINVGDVFNITLTRDATTNDFDVTVNGTKTTLVNSAYTTLNTASVIKFFNEADQRKEGIACFYAWVDRKLADSEILDIQSDPYQIFQTEEEQSQEYGLLVDNSAGNQVDFGGADNILEAGDYHLAVEVELRSLNGFILGYNDSSYRRFELYVNASGVMTVYWQGVLKMTGTTVLSTNTDYLVEVERIGTTTNLWVNGNLEATTETFTEEIRIVRIGNRNGWTSSYLEFLIKELRFQGDTSKRLYNFNRPDTPPYYPDLYGSGSDAVTSGFPEYSGYVYENKDASSIRIEGDFASRYLEFTQVDLTGDFEIEVLFYPDSTNDEIFLGGDAAQGNNWFGLYDNGLEWRSNDAWSNAIAVPLAKRWYKANASRVGTTVTIKLLDIEGNLIGSDTVTSSATFKPSIVGQYQKDNTNYAFSGLIRYVEIKNVLKLDASASNHSAGGQPTLKDTIGGNDAQGVNFPIDGSIWRDNFGARGAVVGYQFNDTETTSLASLIDILDTDEMSIRIQTTPNFSKMRDNYNYLLDHDIANLFGYYKPTNRWYWKMAGSTLYWDRVEKDDEPLTIELRKSASNSYTMEVYFNDNPTPVTTFSSRAFKVSKLMNFWHGSVQSLSVTVNSTLIHNYDFTTGDPDTIIDTVGTNHATITNAPTSGAMPIVERQIFTLGTGKDYETLAAFKNAATLTNIRYIGHIYSAMTDTGDTIWKTNTDITLKAVVDPFTGTNFTGLGHINNYMRGNGGTMLRFENIRSAGGWRVGNYGSIKGVEIRSCYGFTGGNAWFANYASSYYTRIYDSVFVGSRSKFFGVDSNHTFTNTKIYNSMLVDMGGYATTFGVNKGVELYGCLGYRGSNAYGSSAKIFHSEVKGYGNVTLDDSAATAGVGTQDANVLSWITDYDNNDYSINQTGQTALEGQGWNGSDIVSWAYDTAPVTVPEGSVVVTTTGTGTLTQVLAFTKYLQDSAFSTYSGTVTVTPEKPTSSTSSSSTNVADTVVKEIPQTFSISTSSTSTSEIEAIKSIVSNVSATLSDTFSFDIEKLSSSSSSSSGTATNGVSVEKLVPSEVSAVLGVSTSMQIAKYAEGLVAAATSVSSQEAVFKTLSDIVTGVGSITNTTEATQAASGAIQSIVVGAGSTSSAISKILEFKDTLVSSSITADTVAKKISQSFTESLDSSINTTIRKDLSIADYISSASTGVSDTINIHKLTDSNISGASAVLVDLEKNLSLVQNESASGFVVDTVTFSKETGTLLISSEGSVLSVTLGDFEDNNIVLIDLTQAVKDTNISATTKVRDNEFKVTV